MIDKQEEMSRLFDLSDDKFTRKRGDGRTIEFAVVPSLTRRKSPSVYIRSESGHISIAEENWSVRPGLYRILNDWMSQSNIMDLVERSKAPKPETRKVGKQVATSGREEVDLRMLRFIHDIPLDPGYIDTSYGKLATEVRGSKYHTRNSLQQFVTDNYVKVEVLPFNRGIRIEVV